MMVVQRRTLMLRSRTMATLMIACRCHLNSLDAPPAFIPSAQRMTARCKSSPPAMPAGDDACELRVRGDTTTLEPSDTDDCVQGERATTTCEPTRSCSDANVKPYPDESSSSSEMVQPPQIDPSL